MGQILLLRPRPPEKAREVRPPRPAPRPDPTDAARGVLVALALSAMLWVPIAWLVPRLW